MGTIVTKGLRLCLMLALLTLAAASAKAQYATSGQAYYAGSGGIVFVQSRLTSLNTDGSKTYLDYVQPGFQVEFKYGGSLNTNTQVELFARVRYAGYGRLSLVDAPGFIGEVITRDGAGGFYVAGSMGAQMVYSFSARNQTISNGGEQGGLYVMAGLGASLGAQTGFTVRPEAQTPGTTSQLQIESSGVNFIVAPVVNVGVGYEYVSDGGLKVNVFYNADFELDFGNFEQSIILHSLNVGLRF